MIDPHELRLGNWVKNMYDNDVQITVIDDTVNWAKGIQLTEEWLLRMGFEKHKAGISGADMWQGMDAWSINDIGWMFRGDPKFGLKLVGYWNSNIRFAHQLQNLYFALTGEELEIKES